MKNTFTQEDLLLFIYGEAGEMLDARISSALLHNPSLNANYHSLLSSIQSLNEALLEPHDTSIKIIMEESAVSHREEIC